MSASILQALLAELDAGRSAVLVRVTSHRGSVPRKDHPLCVFCEDGRQLGTVGGGCIDGFAQNLAARVLSTGERLEEEHELEGEDAESAGLICGGSLSLAGERLDPGPESRVAVRALLADPALRSPRLLIFGGGHVGQAVGRAAHAAGFAVEVLDDRESFVSAERFPFAVLRLSGSVARADAAPPLGPEDAVVIATRGHRLDLEAMTWAASTRAGFIGLLGSARKRVLLGEKLAADGIDPASFHERWHSPVGLPIGAVTPEEIAAAVAAQLVAFRRGAL